MTAATLPPPPAAGGPSIGENERLGATLVLSVLVHGLLILGVGFALERAAPVVPMLDVMLTQTRSPLTPKQADFLAQASNQGGGEHDKASRPRDPQPGTVPQIEAGVAPQTVRAQSPAPQPPPEARVISSPNSDVRLPTPSRDRRSTPVAQRDGEQKIEHDMAMARLAAEIHLRSSRYAKRPSRKFVSASTQEYAYAQYLKQWVERVERVGNANYPERARAERLEGRLVMTVAVRRNGSVESVVLNTPSRHELLNQAARRIVELAGPYPAVPQGGERVDVLHITRTWHFRNGAVSSED